MQIRCDFHFFDESGSNGQMRLYLPSSLNISAIDAGVSNIAARIQALSGASLTQVNLRLLMLGNYDDAPATSADVSSTLWIVYCDEDGNHEQVHIPFISVSRMQQSGTGAYLRLDEQFPDIPALIDSIRSQFSDIFGNALGEDYNAGILTSGSLAYTLPKR